MLTLWPPGPLEQNVSTRRSFGVDVDVDFFRFRQHGHRRGRRVDAAARFGRRHALDAVHAALVLQPAVDALPFDERDDFLDPAGAAVAEVQDFEPPALTLRVPRVHPEQVRRRRAPLRRRRCRPGFRGRRSSRRSGPSERGGL